MKYAGPDLHGHLRDIQIWEICRETQNIG